METKDLIEILKFCSEVENDCLACKRWNYDFGSRKCLDDLLLMAAAALEEQRKWITELEAEAKNREETVVSLREKWQAAEALICQMCTHCKSVKGDPVVAMVLDCGKLTGYPCCGKFESKNRWIPVTERLPELIPCDAGTAYSEAVNVLTSGRKVLTAIWDGTDFIADAEFWEAENEEITHWTPVLLPLPEPPKGESQC